MKLGRIFQFLGGAITVLTLALLVSFVWTPFYVSSDQNTGYLVRMLEKEVPPAERTSEEQRIIDVYKAVNEAVVFISTITLTVDPFDFFPEVRPREGTGSGIIVDPILGIILTNLHVIRDAHQIEIMLGDGQNYRARLVGYDEEYDVAVLQLLAPPGNLKGLDFGDSAILEVGQRILAIGNPFGLNRTLTTGVVSSLDRTVRTPGGLLMKGLIQTDAAINPGNSGGPLLDSKGRLVGINTAILSQTGQSAGIGFAVPINQIKRVLPELIATGRVLRPKLGWVLVDTNHGAMAQRVTPGGPADLAGIEPIERPVESLTLRGYVRDFSKADLIISLNGVQVSTKDEVEEIVSALKAGDELRVILRRGGISGAERAVVMTPILR